MGPPLGDFKFKADNFENLDRLFEIFDETHFRNLPMRHRFQSVNSMLEKAILDYEVPCFLLPAVLDYIARINEEKIFKVPYLFNHFEFWLNQFSSESNENKILIRSKIMGKYIPRDEYQSFFPIGMDKTYFGSHFVTAHLSPDIDTMIASFWGWVDAFAAKVGSGLHLWNLPGGPPKSPVTELIKELLGDRVFDILARKTSAITLTSLDLVSQRNFVKKTQDVSINLLDHGFNDKAIILVDDRGSFLGNWRSNDVEVVRHVLVLFKSYLYWFENNLHLLLISLFSQPILKIDDLKPVLKMIFDTKINESEHVKDYDDHEKKELENFLTKIFTLDKGLDSTFMDFAKSLEKLSLPVFANFKKEMESLATSDLFDKSGNIIEDRPKIFRIMESIFQHLDQATHEVRTYVETLGVAIKIKYDVLNLPKLVLTIRSDVGEIKTKMRNHNFLTVAYPEEEDQLFPIGVVWANDLHQSKLGTISFRDFSNFEETKMASYLQLISVVDHHKTSMETYSVPLALIGDAQSCNILIAEECFKINDIYSTGGMSLANLMESDGSSSFQKRISQRKYVLKHLSKYFISPKREYMEYFLFLQAILDDTDLLTKVSKRDVECVAELLNRLKSLSIKKDVEIINLDDIPKDEHFANIAAKRILQNEEMFSLYKKIYGYREKEMETQFLSSEKGIFEELFSDTKEQNGCSRVGQTKLFSSNFPTFLNMADKMRQFWFDNAQKIAKDEPEMDLHMHMISTIASANEVYHGITKGYSHQDELWIWISKSQLSHEHLISFLNAFRQSKEVLDNEMTLELRGEIASDYEDIFKRNFIPLKITKNDNQPPIAILRFRGGSINSRKAMISPYLPKYIP